MFWYVIGSMAAILTMFGFLPQICKMLYTKSVGDVSGLTLLQFAIGVFLWMLYGIHLGDYIIILANGIIFLSLVLALTLYFKYGGTLRIRKRR